MRIFRWLRTTTWTLPPATKEQYTYGVEFYSANSGISGISGFSGYSGYSGFSGFSGFSGGSGISEGVGIMLN